VSDDDQYTPERLKALLRRTGTTRADAADLIGVTKRALDTWCLPRTSPWHYEMRDCYWQTLRARLATRVLTV
jgi:hypothetical protein